MTSPYNRPMPGKSVSKRTSHAAVNMKIAGAPYEDIAEVLGYTSPAQARVAVEEQLAGLYQVGDRASLFQLVSARHEALIRSLHDKATTTMVPDTDEFGDEIPGTLVPNKDHLNYAKVYADVLTRYSRLHGLEAPTQVQVTPGGAEFEEVITAMVSKALEGQPQEADIFEIEDAVLVEPGDEDEPVA